MIKNKIQLLFLFIGVPLLTTSLMQAAALADLRKGGITRDQLMENERDNMISGLILTIGPDALVNILNKHENNATCKQIIEQCQTRGWSGKPYLDTNKLIKYFQRNPNELNTVMLMEYNTSSEWEKKFTDAKKKMNENIENRIKKSAEYDETIKNAEVTVARLHGETSSYVMPVTKGVLLGALGIFAAKEGLAYLKESALEPSFCEDTNDVSTLTNLKNWIFNIKTGTYAPNKDRLYFNPEQQATIDALRLGFVKSIEYNLPAPHYLFYGPHGTGKTQFARQLAYETDSIFYIIKASSFLDKNGPRQFRQLMRRIRSSGSRPIVFIDEADDLIGFSSEMKGRRLTIFNDLLSELGDTNNRTCTFIFTTNLPDRIDPRFYNRLTKVQFVNPDIATREKIIANKLKFYFTKDLGEIEPIDYNELTPEIIRLAAEKTKDWSCREYSKFIEELREVLLINDCFACTAQDLFKQIDVINARNRTDALAAVALRDQYSYKNGKKHQAAPAA